MKLIITVSEGGTRNYYLEAVCTKPSLRVIALGNSLRSEWPSGFYIYIYIYIDTEQDQ